MKAAKTRRGGRWCSQQQLSAGQVARMFRVPLSAIEPRLPNGIRYAVGFLEWARTLPVRREAAA